MLNSTLNFALGALELFFLVWVVKLHRVVQPTDSIESDVKLVWDRKMHRVFLLELKSLMPGKLQASISNIMIIMSKLFKKSR